MANWFLVALFVGVQVCGLAAAVIARVCQQQSKCQLWQLVFLAALASVGGVTLMAALTIHAAWLTGGTTIAGMVLSATFGFPQPRL